MDLVEISHRTVRRGDIAKLPDRGDVAIHRVGRFEHDEFRQARVERSELAVESAGSLCAKVSFPAASGGGEQY